MKEVWEGGAAVIKETIRDWAEKGCRTSPALSTMEASWHIMGRESTAAVATAVLPGEKSPAVSAGSVGKTRNPCIALQPITAKRAGAQSILGPQREEPSE